ncbi:hypothetical protein [Microcella sp.]|uniref:hypothetical protein n=1 Tax=Microcella sp. TaxID=1913979 RepID=UPI003F6F98CD
MTTTDRLDERRRRIAAAGIVAIVSVVMAATAHAAAGGGTPSIVAVALALLVSSAIGMGVVGTRLTRARAAIGVAIDQAVFHSLFAFFGASTTGTAVGSAHTAHGMTMTLVDPVTASPSAPAIAMVVTHLGAALIAYGMLRHGLSAIDAVAAALMLALARVLDPAVALPAPAGLPRVAPVGDQRSALSPHLLRLPDRRGPPALTAR